ncbi:MAG: hypothetical protein VX436_01445 [Planctomycetota bacterium]|nr:hypothetical protein [Planctomycetota bacterium]
MNIKTLSLTIGAGSLIAGSAMADYTGLSFTGMDNGDGTWTARIYADFSAATDELDAVFGDADDALSISSNGAGFYQNAFGGATSAAINPAFYDMFPSLMNDSWVTIGLEDQTDNNMLDIGIDWTGFEAGGDISSNNGSWFATPVDPQVLAGDDLRVMVGQFTMYGTDSTISGVLNLQGKQGDFETFQARGQAFSYNMIPAPGALALLGVAGLASRRRRK